MGRRSLPDFSRWESGAPLTMPRSGTAMAGSNCQSWRPIWPRRSIVGLSRTAASDRPRCSCRPWPMAPPPTIRRWPGWSRGRRPTNSALGSSLLPLPRQRRASDRQPMSTMQTGGCESVGGPRKSCGWSARMSGLITGRTISSICSLPSSSARLGLRFPMS